jgi:hypothetical protein
MNLKQLSEKNNQRTAPHESIPVKTGNTLRKDNSGEGVTQHATRRGLIQRVIRRAYDRRWGNRKT